MEGKQHCLDIPVALKEMKYKINIGSALFVLLLTQT